MIEYKIRLISLKCWKLISLTFTYSFSKTNFCKAIHWYHHRLPGASSTVLKQVISPKLNCSKVVFPKAELLLTCLTWSKLIFLAWLNSSLDWLMLINGSVKLHIDFGACDCQGLLCWQILVKSCLDNLHLYFQRKENWCLFYSFILF